MQATNITASGNLLVPYPILAPVPRQLTLGNAVDTVMSATEEVLTFVIAISANGDIVAKGSSNGTATKLGDLQAALLSSAYVEGSKVRIEGWPNTTGKTSRYLQFVIESGTSSWSEVDTALTAGLTDPVMPVRQFVNMAYDAIAPLTDPAVIIVSQDQGEVIIHKGGASFDPIQVINSLAVPDYIEVGQWVQDRDPNSAAGGVWGE